MALLAGCRAWQTWSLRPGPAACAGQLCTAATAVSAYGLVGQSFESLGVHASLIGRLGRTGVHRPSQTQAAVLPVVAEANSAPDTVFHAPTGSGKTLAYLLPMLSSLAALPARQRTFTSGIIMVPTRELALQVAGIASALGMPSGKRQRSQVFARLVGSHKHRAGVGRQAPSPDALEAALEASAREGDWHVAVAKGVLTAHKLAALQRRPPHVLVGTPRALDACVPGLVSASRLRHVVFDEVDSLLLPHNKPYAESLMQVVRKARHRRARAHTEPTPLQALLCGAVPTSTTAAFAASHCRAGWRSVDVLAEGQVDAAPDTPPPSSLVGRLPSHLHHRAIVTSSSLAAEVPAAVGAGGGPTLVFVPSAGVGEEVQAALSAAGVKAALFGGAGMALQHKRRLMRRLREGRVAAVVATDALSRGLDLPRLAHVVNVGAPPDAATYLHRAGRVGRLEAARSGSPRPASTTVPVRQGLVTSIVGGQEGWTALQGHAAQLGIEFTR